MASFPEKLGMKTKYKTTLIQGQLPPVYGGPQGFAGQRLLLSGSENKRVRSSHRHREFKQENDSLEPGEENFTLEL